MSLRVVTPDLNTNIPGAYPSVKVISQPVGLSASGIVVLLGEADGGPSYKDSEFVLADSIATPDQLSRVQSKFISGRLVDAMGAMSAPSNDPNITGSANLIYLVKTNQGVRASATVDSNYGTFKDKNYGTPGNQYNYQVTSTATESAPTVSGGTVPAFGAALNGMAFTIRLSGAAAQVVTLSGTSGNHSNQSTLITELNSLLPVGITASAGTASNSIKFTMATDSSPYRKGFGRSFELYDSVPGDLAALGLTAGLYAAANEAAVQIQINRSDIGLSETLTASAAVALKIGYQGTTATLTLSQSAGTLVTTVVGGSGASLTVQLAQYRTVADLAAFINSQPGYSCSADSSAQQLPTSALDSVTAVSFASSGSAVQAGRVKAALYNFQKAMATSTAISFAATDVAGLPNPNASPVYLSGGARGGTTAADIVAAINMLAGINCNIVVPLFSQDASADLAAGQTDSSSTYTIAAVHLATKNHCIQYSVPKLKKNRIAILSFNGKYTDCKATAQGLAAYRMACAMQSSVQTNSAGVVTTFQPWYTACIAAGMQAGGFYKSITNKFANVLSFVDPSGFDSGSPGDVEDALSAGLLFLTKDTSGNRWVSDQTTYGFDTNFVYNSIQAVYCSDILALDLADAFQKAFVGQSLADVDAATALSFLAQKMDGYKKLKLIASSSDAPLGYKNPKVNILAPEMDIAVEIKLATAIYFIPIAINVSQVQQSA